MAYEEDELIPLSALQLFLYCERQCALIHLERVWEENRFTAEGNVLHERVDDEHRERRKLSRTEYSLPLRSLSLGLSGIADVVEFQLNPAGGYESILPVEYKRGTAKESDVDRVQLCAQALCLEEMFGVPVIAGAFYYVQDHRRTLVELVEPLRTTTQLVAEKTQNLLQQGRTPGAVYEKSKCDRCSLIELCMPRSLGSKSESVPLYLAAQIQQSRHA